MDELIYQIHDIVKEMITKLHHMQLLTSFFLNCQIQKFLKLPKIDFLKEGALDKLYSFCPNPFEPLFNKIFIDIVVDWSFSFDVVSAKRLHFCSRRKQSKHIKDVEHCKKREQEKFYQLFFENWCSWVGKGIGEGDKSKWPRAKSTPANHLLVLKVPCCGPGHINGG